LGVSLKIKTPRKGQGKNKERIKTMKYAIINRRTKEFYPDPIYTDIQKAHTKIDYLIEYREEHNMEFVNYGIEELSKKREEQHNQEWQKFCQAID